MSGHEPVEPELKNNKKLIYGVAGLIVVVLVALIVLWNQDDRKAADSAVTAPVEEVVETEETVSAPKLIDGIPEEVHATYVGAAEYFVEQVFTYSPDDNGLDGPGGYFERLEESFGKDVAKLVNETYEVNSFKITDTAWSEVMDLEQSETALIDGSKTRVEGDSESAVVWVTFSTLKTNTSLARIETEPRVVRVELTDYTPPVHDQANPTVTIHNYVLVKQIGD